MPGEIPVAYVRAVQARDRRKPPMPRRSGTPRLAEQTTALPLTVLALSRPEVCERYSESEARIEIGDIQYRAQVVYRYFNFVS